MHNPNAKQPGVCPDTHSVERLMARVEGEDGTRIEFRECLSCGAQFGPVWHEHQWCEPASMPDWVNLTEGNRL